jgi:hypothetical protein
MVSTELLSGVWDHFLDLVCGNEPISPGSPRDRESITREHLVDCIGAFFKIITVQYSAMGPIKLIQSQMEIALNRVQLDMKNWKYEPSRKTLRAVTRQGTDVSTKPSLQNRVTNNSLNSSTTPSVAKQQSKAETNALAAEQHKRKELEEEVARLKAELLKAEMPDVGPRAGMVQEATVRIEPAMLDSLDGGGGTQPVFTDGATYEASRCGAVYSCYERV